jgi:hypothetical protein
LGDALAGNSANAAAATVAKWVSHGSIEYVHPQAVAYQYYTTLAVGRQPLIAAIFSRKLMSRVCQKSRTRVVSLLRPLWISDYGIVVTEHGLRVAHSKQYY